jgi:pilus assembly protein CpaF
MVMLREQIYQKTLRHFFQPVEDLLFEKPEVTEVLINGPDRIYCESGGKLHLTNRRFDSEESLEMAVRNLAEYVGRRLDENNHSMDARLPPPEGFRVHAIIPPASRAGICLSIRKFGKKNETTLDWLVGNGSLTPEVAEYLRLMVACHRNIVVSGGTGSGKTSLLNALSFAIDERERIVVIEDSSELRLAQEHTVYLEAKQPGPDGKGGVTIRNLFVDSLRMRPDRIIVGEVRRGEALDLIQSMLSGHDGALTTVHASNPLLALVRLETLCLMSDVALPVYVARAQVAHAIQVVVQIARMKDGSRRVTGISEGAGLAKGERYRMRKIFELKPGSQGQQLAWTGKISRFSADVLDQTKSSDRELSAAVWGTQP